MGSIRGFKCKCGIYLSIKLIKDLEYDKVYKRKCPKCNYINKIKIKEEN